MEAHSGATHAHPTGEPYRGKEGNGQLPAGTADGSGCHRCINAKRAIVIGNLTFVGHLLVMMVQRRQRLPTEKQRERQ